MTTTAPLLNVPRTQDDWNNWTFQLSQNVADILRAIRLKSGENIADPQLFPLPANDVSRWLERASGVIDEICSALGINAADVENVDIQDEHERQAWVFTIYSELNAARQILKI